MMFAITGVVATNSIIRFVVMALAVTISLVTGFASSLLCDLNKKNQELDKAKTDLEKTLAQVKELEGLLPICMYCKSIRDDSGYWHKLEEYISSNSKAEFTHGICDKCLAEKHSKRLTIVESVAVLEEIGVLEPIDENAEEIGEVDRLDEELDSKSSKP